VVKIVVRKKKENLAVITPLQWEITTRAKGAVARIGVEGRRDWKEKQNLVTDKKKGLHQEALVRGKKREHTEGMLHGGRGGVVCLCTSKAGRVGWRGEASKKGRC